MSDDSQSVFVGHWPEWMRTHRPLLAAGGHVFLFAVSWLVAFGLAYNFHEMWTGVGWFPNLFLPLLPLVLAVKLVIFTAMGLHRSSWRYVSLRDVMQVTKAAFVSFTWIFAVYYGAVNIEFLARLLGVEGFTFEPFGGRDFPDSVLILDFAGTVALICGARFAVRLYQEEIQPVQEGTAPKLLILGAGDAGETVVREILRLPMLQYRVVGFLDDDRSKWRAQIHGVEVLGGIDKIKETCDELSVDEILIAIPSATQRQLRRVIELCSGTKLRFQWLPSVSDLIDGRVTVSQIRPVDINDLLGREAVQLDADALARFLCGRRVLITGAGGSIGSEMCRQVCHYDPALIALIEQAETPLFEIDNELRASFGKVRLWPFVCDIYDCGRVIQV